MSMDSAVGIIPARWASSRFPGKALANVAGAPMIRHVWEGARASTQLRDVIVATDSEAIAEVCDGFGATVALTSRHHSNGTSRVAEAAEPLEDQIIVNIQGDEPLIRGSMIDASLDALRASPETSMATLAHPVDAKTAEDPNRVKVILDQRGNALYFSRQRIPHEPGPNQKPVQLLQHVGIYAYRRDFLLAFVDLAPTPLEEAERLEQLRALEHGHAVRVAVLADWTGLSVDVPADIPRVEALIRARGTAGEFA
jgi:3-deoxy-manno-octulosonate cytidylyltransferase (CMP-KDO synthetase)